MVDIYFIKKPHRTRGLDEAFMYIIYHIKHSMSSLSFPHQVLFKFRYIYKDVTSGFFLHSLNLTILHNGFGISEVAGGISERSGEIPKGNFAYSVLCEVASVSERRAEPELFPKPLCRKGASDPTAAQRREGERAISA